MVSQTESQIIKYLSTSQNRLNLVLRLLEKRTLENLSPDPLATYLENSKQSTGESVDILVINLLEEISDQVLGISRYMNILHNPDKEEN